MRVCECVCTRTYVRGTECLRGDDVIALAWVLGTSTVGTQYVRVLRGHVRVLALACVLSTSTVGTKYVPAYLVPTLYQHLLRTHAVLAVQGY
jgi:hypothetical protein